MILLSQEIALSVLVAMSIPTGYMIGITVQDEIETLSKKLFVTKIFNFPLIIAEIIVISTVLGALNLFYFLTGGILIVINIVLSTLYSAEKSDLQRILAYTVSFLIPTLIIGAIIII